MFPFWRTGVIFVFFAATLRRNPTRRKYFFLAQELLAPEGLKAAKSRGGIAAMGGAKDADEMTIPQLKAAINRHFRNFSDRQKDFKTIERKHTDSRVDTCVYSDSKLEWIFASNF